MNLKFHSHLKNFFFYEKKNFIFPTSKYMFLVFSLFSYDSLWHLKSKKTITKKTSIPNTLTAPNRHKKAQINLQSIYYRNTVVCYTNFFNDLHITNNSFFVFSYIAQQILFYTSNSVSNNLVSRSLQIDIVWCF